jgi:hypothetical protein
VPYWGVSVEPDNSAIHQGFQETLSQPRLSVWLALRARTAQAAQGGSAYRGDSERRSEQPHHVLSTSVRDATLLKYTLDKVQYSFEG